MKLVKKRGSNRPARGCSLFSGLFEEDLRQIVEKVSIPRHFVSERQSNQLVGKWIEDEFQRMGYQTFLNGEAENIVASFSCSPKQWRVLLGAHYDSVPGSPGADDNGSAIAALLSTAKALASLSNPGIVFVAFNREEENLRGSTEFVKSIAPYGHSIELAHILEMVGFSSSENDSQECPRSLPINLGSVGDFIAIVSNQDSNHYVQSILDLSSQFVPRLSVYGLLVPSGIEVKIPTLLRSDHAPFWRGRIPAVMWTDTAEFRNQNYHKKSDLPETLNYSFLMSVTQLLIVHISSFFQRG